MIINLSLFLMGCAEEPHSSRITSLNLCSGHCFACSSFVSGFFPPPKKPAREQTGFLNLCLFVNECVHGARGVLQQTAVPSRVHPCPVPNVLTTCIGSTMTSSTTWPKDYPVKLIAIGYYNSAACLPCLSNEIINSKLC